MANARSIAHGGSRASGAATYFFWKFSTPWNSRVQSQSPTCWTHGEREVYSARRTPCERARLCERSGKKVFHTMENSTLKKHPKNAIFTPPQKTPKTHQKHPFLAVFNPFLPQKRLFSPFFRPNSPQNFSTPWNSRVQSQSPTCWTHGEREVYSAQRQLCERASLGERSGNILFPHFFHTMEKSFPHCGIAESRAKVRLVGRMANARSIAHGERRASGAAKCSP